MKPVERETYLRMNSLSANHENVKQHVECTNAEKFKPEDGNSFIRACRNVALWKRETQNATCRAVVSRRLFYIRKRAGDGHRCWRQMQNALLRVLGHQHFGVGLCQFQTTPGPGWTRRRCNCCGCRWKAHVSLLSTLLGWEMYFASVTLTGTNAFVISSLSHNVWSLKADSAVTQHNTDESTMFCLDLSAKNVKLVTMFRTERSHLFPQWRKTIKLSSLTLNSLNLCGFRLVFLCANISLLLICHFHPKAKCNRKLGAICHAIEHYLNGYTITLRLVSCFTDNWMLLHIKRFEWNRRLAYIYTF